MQTALTHLQERFGDVQTSRALVGAHRLLHAVFGDRSPYRGIDADGYGEDIEMPCPELDVGLDAWLVDKPHLQPMLADGHSVVWAIMQAMKSLAPRERLVLVRRFWGKGNGSWSLETVGASLGVTRERVRQMEAKALRRMTHPSRSRQLRGLLHEARRDEVAAFLARKELAEGLARRLPEHLAYEVAARVKRRDLAKALQALTTADIREVGRRVAASCQAATMLDRCMFCGEPALPLSDVCLVHVREWRRVPVKCDWCGVIKSRSPSSFPAYQRTHGKSQAHLFCSIEHFFEALRAGWYPRKSRRRAGNTQRARNGA